VSRFENVIPAFVPSRGRARKVPQAENHGHARTVPWVRDSDAPGTCIVRGIRSTAHDDIAAGTDREIPDPRRREAPGPFLDGPAFHVARRIDRGLTRLQGLERSRGLDVERAVRLMLQLRARGEHRPDLRLRRTEIQLTASKPADLGLGPPRAEHVVDM